VGAPADPTAAQSAAARPAAARPAAARPAAAQPAAARPAAAQPATARAASARTAPEPLASERPPSREPLASERPPARSSAERSSAERSWGVSSSDPAVSGTGAAGASLTHPDRPPLPVAPDLAALLPDAALRRGTSVVVTGSTSLVLALVAQASQEGSWVAVVGLPAVGLLAAQQAGVVLDRLAVVPRPGPDAPTVLAALLDGVDLVVVGDGAALVDSDRRRLTARARERGAVLLSTAPWPGAQLVLSAEPVEWTGLGVGHGHLRRHRLAVTRSGRGSAGRGVRAEVVLPVRLGTAARSASAPARRPADQTPAVPLRMVG
jgi:hypothetical protein